MFHNLKTKKIDDGMRRMGRVGKEKQKGEVGEVPEEKWNKLSNSTVRQRRQLMFCMLK